MTRMVQCVVLKREAEGFDAPPHPGELGLKVYEQVSREGWGKWLERLTMIINENGISTADPASIPVIEQHMRGFLFGEGGAGAVPEGFRPAGAKK